jgi:hypothetical protein
MASQVGKEPVEDYAAHAAPVSTTASTDRSMPPIKMIIVMIARMDVIAICCRIFCMTAQEMFSSQLK